MQRAGMCIQIKIKKPKWSFAKTAMGFGRSMNHLHLNVDAMPFATASRSTRPVGKNGQGVAPPFDIQEHRGSAKMIVESLVTPVKYVL